MSDVCHYVYSEFGLLSDVFGEVVLLSGRVRRCRLCVGTCSVRSI